MNIGLTDITHSFRSRGEGLGVSIKHGHAQQLLVAAFGYKTLASYQAAKASAEEPDSFDLIHHLILDRDCLNQRLSELGIECDIEQLSHLLSRAFADRLAHVVLHRSYADLTDHIRKEIEHVVENNGRITGQIDELNHDGIEEVYSDPEVNFEQLLVGMPFTDSIPGHVSLHRDPERPYTGTKMDFQLSLAGERLGRRCYSSFEYEVTHVLLSAPWKDHMSIPRSSQHRLWPDIDEEVDAPPVRTKAEVVAELLGWTVDEVEGIQDVEEMPLDGNSGDMIYGYLLDFTDYASSDEAARIMQEHGTLQFRVGPDFFVGIRYDGWPH